jgi:hypothetical protein
MAGEPDPLTGIFAVLLAAPWIWLTGPITIIQRAEGLRPRPSTAQP